MKSLKTLILETANTHAADINEIMLATELGGGDWSKIHDAGMVKNQLGAKVAKISVEDTNAQWDRAKRMSDEIFKWLPKNGYKRPIRKVWWVARKGMLEKIIGTGIADDKNPTDVLIQFTDNVYLGISAKSTKKNGDIPAKNPGIGTLERSLGIDLNGTHKRLEDAFIKKYDLPRIASKRKIAVRTLRGMKEKADIEGTKSLVIIADMLFAQLSTMSNQNLRDHILKEWLDASEIVYPPYIKVTGKQNSVKIEDPFKNDKFTALMKDTIELKRTGSESIKVYAGGVPILKMRVKFESQKMASTIKFSADALPR